MSEALAESERHARLPGYVPELDCKLDYLIKERGGHGLDERGRRSKARIQTQKDFADTIKIHNSNITRWRQDSRIPSLAVYVAKIAEAFDCDGQSFRTDDCETFKRRCEFNRPSWGRLINGSAAQVDLEAIKPVGAKPVAAGLDARIGDLHRYLVDLEEKTPFVAPGQAFEVTFVAPDGEGAVSAWAGWHVLIFSGDRDGFLTWMPRHRNEPEFKGAGQFPVNFRELVLPRQGGENLRTGRRSWGEHDVVLVVSRERVPAGMQSVFETPAKNKALADTLDQLAVWLEPRIAISPPAAAVVRAPYFVGFGHSEPAAPG